MIPTSTVSKHRLLAGRRIDLAVSKIMLSQVGGFNIRAKV